MLIGISGVVTWSGGSPPGSARSGSFRGNPKRALLEWAQSRIGYDIADIKVSSLEWAQSRIGYDIADIKVSLLELSQSRIGVDIAAIKPTLLGRAVIRMAMTLRRP